MENLRIPDLVHQVPHPPGISQPRWGPLLHFLQSVEWAPADFLGRQGQGQRILGISGYSFETMEQKCMQHFNEDQTSSSCSLYVYIYHQILLVLRT